MSLTSDLVYPGCHCERYRSNLSRRNEVRRIYISTAVIFNVLLLKRLVLLHFVWVNTMQEQKDANGVQHNSPGCNPGNRAPKHTPMPHPNGVLCGLRCWTPLGFFFWGGGVRIYIPGILPGLKCDTPSGYFLAPNRVIRLSYEGHGYWSPWGYFLDPNGVIRLSHGFHPWLSKPTQIPKPAPQRGATCPFSI